MRRLQIGRDGPLDEVPEQRGARAASLVLQPGGLAREAALEDVPPHTQRETLDDGLPASGSAPPRASTSGTRASTQHGMNAAVHGVPRQTHVVAGRAAE